MERGETGNERDESSVDSYICTHILRPYYDEAKYAEERLKKIGDNKIPLHIKITLIRRWCQIKDLIRSAFQGGINPQTQDQMLEIFDAPSPYVTRMQA